MSRTTPAETKLTICVWHPFTEWRPKPAMAEAIRKRWPEMRVLHLPKLNGKVLLIVGYGSIGKEVAKRAKAFDMRVWGVTRSGKGEQVHVEKIFAAAQLAEALPGADYVLICAPETPETKHLIGAAEIAKMKRGARLINVGRGSLLDEAALVQALESGGLGGAALDVTETEPLPAESSLCKAPNLFITPHTSRVSDTLWDRQGTILIDLLERWFVDGRYFDPVGYCPGYSEK